MDGSKGFTEGDNVELLDDRLIIVARGFVSFVDANRTCHSVKVGPTRSVIRISEALDLEARLPYAHPDAETVNAGKGSNALWDDDKIVRLLPQAQCPGTPNAESGHANEDLHEGHDDHGVDIDGSDVNSGSSERDDISEEGGPQPSPGPSNTHATDYTKRSNWMHSEVRLYSPDSGAALGTGKIRIAHPDGAFEGEKIGDLNVGVVVRTYYCGYDTTVRKKWFPNALENQHCFVKWPKEFVAFVDSKGTLADIVLEGQSEEMPSAGKKPHSRSKRAYTFKTRLPADPVKKRLRRTASKAVSKITEKAVDDVQAVRCCRNQCTRFARREHIFQTRQAYFGMSHSDRTTMIYNKFHDRPREAAENGLMLFEGETICKDAFAAIYGMSRSTFHNKQNEAMKKGARVGLHGNKGSKKARPNTLMGAAAMMKILKLEAEPMPHETYKGKNGSDEVVYKLPSSTKRREIYDRANREMVKHGYMDVSEPNYSNVWNRMLKNFQIHTSGAFSHCSVCTTFKEAYRIEVRKWKQEELMAEHKVHLNGQLSRRNDYYANMMKAEDDPEKNLSIIHDKMDQNKTWIPRVSTWTAKLKAGQPLPMALTGALLHGRQPSAFCHWVVRGLWPGDPDFTITSLAKMFRDLENFKGDKSGDLIFTPSQTTKPLFRSLLDRAAFEVGYPNPDGIPTESRFRGDTFAQLSNSTSGACGTRRTTVGSTSTAPRSDFKKLPPHLFLQMDNSSKDNKNQTVMAFLSELVARGVFVTITMSFLMVGHTHEDIDAFFSKVHTKMSGAEIGTFPALMAKTWECEKDSPISFLIQEVAHYSLYVEPFAKKLSGQSYPIAILFSMKNGRPVYQVKERLEHPWTPTLGSLVWRENVKPELGITLPERDEQPKAKPMELPHKHAKEISAFLDNYTSFKRDTAKDSSSKGYAVNAPLIRYWENIRELITQGAPVEVGSTVLECEFWPRTNHGTGYRYGNNETSDNVRDETEREDRLDAELREEEAENNVIFVGPPGERSRERFVPLKDIVAGKFVILRPDDDFEKLYPRRIWLVKALGGVVEDTASSNHHEFQIEWWRPVHRKHSANDARRYENCLPSEKPGQTWEKDPGYPQTTEIWQKADAAIFSWKSNAKGDKVNLNRKLIVEAINKHIEDVASE